MIEHFILLGDIIFILEMLPIEDEDYYWMLPTNHKLFFSKWLHLYILKRSSRLLNNKLSWFYKYFAPWHTSIVMVFLISYIRFEKFEVYWLVVFFEFCKIGHIELRTLSAVVDIILYKYLFPFLTNEISFEFSGI